MIDPKIFFLSHENSTFKQNKIEKNKKKSRIKNVIFIQINKTKTNNFLN